MKGRKSTAMAMLVAVAVLMVFASLPVHADATTTAGLQDAASRANDVCDNYCKGQFGKGGTCLDKNIPLSGKTKAASVTCQSDSYACYCEVSSGASCYQACLNTYNRTTSNCGPRQNCIGQVGILASPTAIPSIDCGSPDSQCCCMQPNNDVQKQISSLTAVAVIPMDEECGLVGGTDYYNLRVGGTWTGGQALQISVYGAGAAALVPTVGPGLSSFLHGIGWYWDSIRVPRALVEAGGDTVVVRYTIIPYQNQVLATAYMQSLVAQTSYATYAQPGYTPGVNTYYPNTAGAYSIDSLVVCEHVTPPAPLVAPPLEEGPAPIDIASISCTPAGGPTNPATGLSYQNAWNLIDLNLNTNFQFSSPIVQSGAAGTRVSGGSCKLRLNGWVRTDGTVETPTIYGLEYSTLGADPTADNVLVSHVFAGDKSFDVNASMITTTVLNDADNRPYFKHTVAFADYVPVPITGRDVVIQFNYTGTPSLRELQLWPDLVTVKISAQTKSALEGMPVFLEGNVTMKTWTDGRGNTAHCAYQWNGSCIPCSGDSCEAAKPSLGSPYFSLIPFPQSWQDFLQKAKVMSIAGNITAATKLQLTPPLFHSIPIPVIAGQSWTSATISAALYTIGYEWLTSFQGSPAWMKAMDALFGPFLLFAIKDAQAPGGTCGKVGLQGSGVGQTSAAWYTKFPGFQFCDIPFFLMIWWDLDSAPEPDPDTGGPYTLVGESTCKHPTDFDLYLANTGMWSLFQPLADAMNQMAAERAAERQAGLNAQAAQSQSCSICTGGFNWGTGGVLVAANFDDVKKGQIIVACQDKVQGSWTNLASKKICKETDSTPTLTRASYTGKFTTASGSCPTGMDDVTGFDKCYGDNTNNYECRGIIDGMEFSNNQKMCVNGNDGTVSGPTTSCGNDMVITTYSGCGAMFSGTPIRVTGGTWCARKVQTNAISATTATTGQAAATQTQATTTTALVTSSEALNKPTYGYLSDGTDVEGGTVAVCVPSRQTCPAGTPDPISDCNACAANDGVSKPKCMTRSEMQGALQNKEAAGIKDCQKCKDTKDYVFCMKSELDDKGVSKSGTVNGYCHPLVAGEPRCPANTPTIAYQEVSNCAFYNNLRKGPAQVTPGQSDVDTCKACLGNAGAVASGPMAVFWCYNRNAPVCTSLPDGSNTCCVTGGCSKTGVVTAATKDAGCPAYSKVQALGGVDGALDRAKKASESIDGFIAQFCYKAHGEIQTVQQKVEAQPVTAQTAAVQRVIVPIETTVSDKATNVCSNPHYNTLTEGCTNARYDDCAKHCCLRKSLSNSIANLNAQKNAATIEEVNALAQALADATAVTDEAVKVAASPAAPGSGGEQQIPATGTLAGAAVPVPSGLTVATGTTADGVYVTLNWGPVKDATYKVYAKVDASVSKGGFTRLKSSITNYYTERGLDSGVRTCYGVSAVTSAGESGLSNEVCVTTGAPTTAQTTPVVTLLSPSEDDRFQTPLDSAFELQFNKKLGGFASQHVSLLYPSGAKVACGCSPKDERTILCKPSRLLTPSTTYTIKVDGALTFADSTILGPDKLFTFNTVAISATPSTVSLTQNVQATKSIQTIGFIGNLICKLVDTGELPAPLSGLGLNCNCQLDFSNCTISGTPVLSGQYRYKIYVSGYSDNFVTVDVNVVAAAAHAVLTGLTATGGSGQITFSWNTVANADYYGMSFNSPGIQTFDIHAKIKVTNIVVNTFAGKPLASGTRYCATVTAYASNGDIITPDRNEVCASTVQTQAATSQLTATGGLTSTGAAIGLAGSPGVIKAFDLLARNGQSQFIKTLIGYLGEGETVYGREFVVQPSLGNNSQDKCPLVDPVFGRKKPTGTLTPKQATLSGVTYELSDYMTMENPAQPLDTLVNITVRDSTGVVVYRTQVASNTSGLAGYFRATWIPPYAGTFTIDARPAQYASVPEPATLNIEVIPHPVPFVTLSPDIVCTKLGVPQNVVSLDIAEQDAPIAFTNYNISVCRYADYNVTDTTQCVVDPAIGLAALGTNGATAIEPSVLVSLQSNSTFSNVITSAVTVPTKMKVRIYNGTFNLDVTKNFTHIAMVAPRIRLSAASSRTSQVAFVENTFALNLSNIIPNGCTPTSFSVVAEPPTPTGWTVTVNNTVEVQGESSASVPLSITPVSPSGMGSWPTYVLASSSAPVQLGADTDALSVTADERYVYYTTTGEKLKKFDTVTNAQVGDGFSIGSKPGGIAIDGGYVYFAAGGTISRTSRDAWAPTIVATGVQTEGSQLNVDNSYVWWLEHFETADRIKRIAKASNAADCSGSNCQWTVISTAANTTAVYDISTDPNFLYWTSNGEIKRVAKSWAGADIMTAAETVFVNKRASTLAMFEGHVYAGIDEGAGKSKVVRVDSSGTRDDPLSLNYARDYVYGIGRNVPTDMAVVNKLAWIEDGKVYAADREALTDWTVVWYDYCTSCTPTVVVLPERSLAPAGDMAAYTVNVTNTVGVAVPNWTIVTDMPPAGWSVDLSTNTFDLGPAGTDAGSALIRAYVKSPANATGVDSWGFLVTAFKAGVSGRGSATYIISSHLRPNVTATLLDPADVRALPGKAVGWSLSVKNNDPPEFAIPSVMIVSAVQASLPSGWTSWFQVGDSPQRYNNVTLLIPPADLNRSVKFYVQSSVMSADGAYNIWVKASNSGVEGIADAMYNILGCGNGLCEPERGEYTRNGPKWCAADCGQGYDNFKCTFRGEATGNSWIECDKTRENSTDFGLELAVANYSSLSDRVVRVCARNALPASCLAVPATLCGLARIGTSAASTMSDCIASMTLTGTGVQGPNWFGRLACPTDYYGDYYLIFSGISESLVALERRLTRQDWISANFSFTCPDYRLGELATTAQTWQGLQTNCVDRLGVTVQQLGASSDCAQKQRRVCDLRQSHLANLSLVVQNPTATTATAIRNATASIERQIEVLLGSSCFNVPVLTITSIKAPGAK